MKTDEIVMGIDLGTTNSCVGVWNNEEQIVMILPNSEGSKTTPSWVGYNEQLAIVNVGKKAAGSFNHLYDVKRIIGNTKEAVKEYERLLPFVIVEGKE